MHRIKTLASALVVALVVITSLDYAASAATGHSFVLGQLNKANTVTTLKRTTPGPALNLVTKPSTTAPLTVNGTGKVTNLNADSVDGQDSSAFQPTIGALVWHNLQLAAGWNSCYTGTPQYAVRLGVVYLRGSLCDGTTGSDVFTLPTEARPTRTGTNLYLVVDQETANTGRLIIDSTTGVATSQTQPGHAGADTGFTSLEGVSYTL